MGLLEPINTRITDPQYFLDTPQQGRNLVLCHLLALFGPHIPKSHGYLPGSPPSGSHFAEGWETQSAIANGESRWVLLQKAMSSGLGGTVEDT